MSPFSRTYLVSHLVRQIITEYIYVTQKVDNKCLLRCPNNFPVSIRYALRVALCNVLSSTGICIVLPLMLKVQSLCVKSALLAQCQTIHST